MYEVKENSPTPNLQALEGNTYYFKCPNDNRYYKTIYQEIILTKSSTTDDFKWDIWRTPSSMQPFLFICSFVIAYQFISI